MFQIRQKRRLSKNANVKTLMKKLLSTIAFLILLSGAYAFGYKNGGEEYAYLEHVIEGSIASADMIHCERSSAPLDCYKFDQQLKIETALMFYVEDSKHLSETSKYFFPETYEYYQMNLPLIFYNLQRH